MESHTRDKKYPCIFCPKVFEVSKSRYVHYSRSHRQEFDELKAQKKFERLQNICEVQDISEVLE